MKVYRVFVTSPEFQGIAGEGWAFKLSDGRFSVVSDAAPENSHVWAKCETKVLKEYDLEKRDLEVENNVIEQKKAIRFHLNQIQSMLG